MSRVFTRAISGSYPIRPCLRNVKKQGQEVKRTKKGKIDFCAISVLISVDFFDDAHENSLGILPSASASVDNHSDWSQTATPKNPNKNLDDNLKFTEVHPAMGKVSGHRTFCTCKITIKIPIKFCPNKAGTRSSFS